MKTRVEILASVLAVGSLIGTLAYAQSSTLSTLAGHHNATLVTPNLAAGADRKSTLKYTDPTSGQTTSDYVLSGNVVFEVSGSAARWTTDLLVINTKTKTMYAKSLTISGVGRPSTAVGVSPDKTGGGAPNCAAVTCTYTASEGQLYINGYNPPGNTVVGPPMLEGATVTADGDQVVITSDTTIITTGSMTTIPDSGSGCDVAKALVNKALAKKGGVLPEIDSCFPDP